MPQKVIKLKTPLSNSDVTKLKLGDLISISGVAYEFKNAPQYVKLLELISNGTAPMKELENAIICHTFSSVERDSKPPTLNYFGFITSTGFSKFMPDVLKTFRCKAIMGKAGLTDDVLTALHDFDSVYLAGVNGCSAHYTRRVRRIDIVFNDLIPGGVVKYEFEDLHPMIVTMDSHGNSLHKNVNEQKKLNLAKLRG